MAEWDEDELRAAVRAYLGMLSVEQSGASYNKAEIRRELRKGALRNRSSASIEYRMRNISSVLAAHDQQTIKGYLGAPNVGEAVANNLWKMISDEKIKKGGATRKAYIGKKEEIPGSSVRPPMVYFNIGWMERYGGVFYDDVTKGAHGYLQEHPHGAEAFNFAETETGTVRGYRPPGKRERLNIANMGAPASANSISGALVVWLAKEPASKKTLVVGWYRNATVFREAQERTLEVNGEQISYSAETAVGDAILLPPVLRTFQVESSRTKPGGGFGQKPTWYGAESVDSQVWAYISSHGSHSKPELTEPPKNYDPELRRKVEKAAVTHATAYYEELYGIGCVKSVEAKAKGWDLEVSVGREPLLVEVKGLMNHALICELTPNEFENMMLQEHRARYVIYVVNNALATAPAVPIASIFEWVDEDHWFTADGRRLTITPKIAAVLSCE
jgi:Domain of unknown function (DUF3883)